MTANSTYKPNEGKREEFRKYLEKTGVMDALTKVFVQLYEETEKPDNALQFIQNAIAKHLGQETAEELASKCNDLLKKVKEMEEEMEKMKLVDPQSPSSVDAPPAEQEAAADPPAVVEAQ